VTDAKGTSHADRHLDHGGNDHHLFTNGSGASLPAGKATTAKRYCKNLRMSMPLRVHAERLLRRFSTTCKELARTRWFQVNTRLRVHLWRCPFRQAVEPVWCVKQIDIYESQVSFVIHCALCGLSLW